MSKTRTPTVPWPNPWSHPLPTFYYSVETKCISVKFYVDPLISGQWPRGEREWNKAFLVASHCTEPVKICSFNEISRWAPNSRFIRWTGRSFQWNKNHPGTLGVEESPLIVDSENGYPTRFKWEIEQV